MREIDREREQERGEADGVCSGVRFKDAGLGFGDEYLGFGDEGLGFGDQRSGFREVCGFGN